MLQESRVRPISAGQILVYLRTVQRRGHLIKRQEGFMCLLVLGHKFENFSRISSKSDAWRETFLFFCVLAGYKNWPPTLDFLKKNLVSSRSRLFWFPSRIVETAVANATSFEIGFHCQHSLIIESLPFAGKKAARKNCLSWVSCLHAVGSYFPTCLLIHQIFMAQLFFSFDFSSNLVFEYARRRDLSKDPFMIIVFSG